jgi:hypothetical protein
VKSNCPPVHSGGLFQWEEMSMTKIVTMETGKLDLLAKRIRNGIDLRQQSDAEWVQATLDLSAALAEARDYFNADIAFGRWLDDSGFDLSKNDRAAYIAFGSELERARGILENTERRSVREILRLEFRVPRSGKPAKPKTDPGLTNTPEMEKALAAYDAFKASGVEPTQQQVEDRAKVSSTVVRRAFERRKTEAELAKQEPDLASLSASAKAKVEAAVRKIQKRMDAEYSMRLQHGIHAYVIENVLPSYSEKLALADRIIAVNKRPFTIEEYRKLLAALHPDNTNHEQRTAAFVLFKQRELLLRPPEKDKPLSGDLPKTIEELLARRKKR